jgi:hypothetical protein
VPTIRVWDKLVKVLTQTERKSLLENQHVYIAAMRWIEAGGLKVKVWGYGGSILRASHGFTATPEMVGLNG